MSKTYKELIKDREALDKEIEKARDAEKEAAIKSIRELIDLFKLTAKDCGFKSSGTKKKASEDGNKPDGRSAPKKPKYRNPNNPDDTWTGLGATSRRPKWVVEYEAAGGKIEDCLIKE